jgi:hypothetical protein
LKTIQRTSETDAASLLAKARSAILEGGFDDLASAAKQLSGLIKEQHNPQSKSKDKPVSPLVRPLLAIADILAADTKYLQEAISAYGDAAHFSVGRDEDLNKQSLTCILEKAELLPAAEDRIEAYQRALQEAPDASPIAELARHKAEEQKDPAYFKLRSPIDQPRLEETLIEGDLRVVPGDGISQVIRHQAPTGVIYYSVVVPRGFSREKLTQAGVQNAQEMVRTRVNDEFDRILIPANRLSQQTQRDIDFISRLKNSGIYLDAVHGRARDENGAVTGYKFPEGANPDRMRYMGIDSHGILPQDGKIMVPIERVKFYADPALIGKWIWLPTGGGKMKSCIPPNERPELIQSLQTYGIYPCDDDASAKHGEYVVVSKDAKGRLKNIIHQHVLQVRSKNLLNFAEALPSSASGIAVAAYKDACSFVFGLRNSR